MSAHRGPSTRHYAANTRVLARFHTQQLPATALAQATGRVGPRRDGVRRIPGAGAESARLSTRPRGRARKPVRQRAARSRLAWLRGHPNV